MINKRKNLIVFDMDGVIVDVSKSYRDTVRRTARLFFKGAPGWGDLPEPLFSLQDLAGIKQSGGLNNDWELTYHVLNLLVTRVHIPEISKEADPWRLHEKTLQGCRLEGLVNFLASHRSPLSHLQQEAGIPRSRFIQKMSSNDVGSGNVIKHIFQEIYLGRSLFKATYHLPARYATGEGLITRETLLIDPADFRTLAAGNLLALATGRPEAEATYARDHFNIRPYFSSVFSLDDCLRAEKIALVKTNKTVSLSKPHPFMLDAIAEIHAADTLQRYYVGDMPDDMLAANRSAYGYTGIGIVTASPNKANLKQALQISGARYIIQDISELYKILVDKP